jgi:hypothetical protein
MLAGIAESYEEVLVTQSRHSFEVMPSSSQHEYDGWRNQARLRSLRIALALCCDCFAKIPNHSRSNSGQP